MHSDIHRISLSFLGESHNLGFRSKIHVSSLWTFQIDKESNTWVLCVLLTSIFCVSRHEKAAILVMLLAKSLHCLLLWIGTPLRVLVVLRSQVGLRELKRHWPRSTGPLTTRVEEQVKASYGILAQR